MNFSIFITFKNRYCVLFYKIFTREKILKIYHAVTKIPTSRFNREQKKKRILY